MLLFSGQGVRNYKKKKKSLLNFTINQSLITANFVVCILKWWKVSFSRRYWGSLLNSRLNKIVATHLGIISRQKLPGIKSTVLLVTHLCTTVFWKPQLYAICSLQLWRHTLDCTVVISDSNSNDRGLVV